MYFGADYYPEHVSPDVWEKDASLMKDAGFTATRLAEFAWAFMEPEEGKFCFSWLDEAIQALSRRGITVILGTPTASMPARVARAYPETLAVDAAGKRHTWGSRRNNCPSSVTYRLLAGKITRAMADRCASSPAVIGWQVDNELGEPFCYCDSCRVSFRESLRKCYGSLEELNRAWGAHFWGHRLDSWDQIPLADDPASQNPGLCLDFRRHHSWLNVRFLTEQAAILRARCPGHFVTHNFMGLYSGIDYAALAQDLDFVSWDNYPVWHAPGIRYDAALAADIMRGLKKKGFWIMEQTAGARGWGVMGLNPRPGEIRQVAWQQAARGAESQLLFCWRTSAAGREQYWHGLLGHDGKPGRRYEEASRTARELHEISGRLEGTAVRADVAMIYDYESAWAFEIQPGYEPRARNPGEEHGSLAGLSNYQDAARRYHRALFRAGFTAEVIRPADDFSGYKAVFAPHLYILPDRVACRMSDYVRAGGVLLADCRTAVKDGTGLCHPRTLPGLLTDALGISMEEYEALDHGMRYALACEAPFSAKHAGTMFADWVTPCGAETLARYDQWHLRGKAAVTRNRYGSGYGYYVGTIAESESFYDQLVADVLARAEVKGMRIPCGVEAVVREGGGKRLLFLINHTEEQAIVEVPDGKKDLLTGLVASSTVTLERSGVVVLELS